MKPDIILTETSQILLWPVIHLFWSNISISIIHSKIYIFKTGGKCVTLRLRSHPSYFWFIPVFDQLNNLICLLQLPVLDPSRVRVAEQRRDLRIRIGWSGVTWHIQALRGLWRGIFSNIYWFLRNLWRGHQYLLRGRWETNLNKKAFRSGPVPVPPISGVVVPRALWRGCDPLLMDPFSSVDVFCKAETCAFSARWCIFRGNEINYYWLVIVSLVVEFGGSTYFSGKCSLAVLW